MQLTNELFYYKLLLSINGKPYHYSKLQKYYNKLLQSTGYMLPIMLKGLIVIPCMAKHTAIQHAMTIILVTSTEIFRPIYVNDYNDHNNMNENDSKLDLLADIQISTVQIDIQI